MRDFTKHCVYGTEFLNPPFSTNIHTPQNPSQKTKCSFFCEARPYVWSTVPCARFEEHGGMCVISGARWYVRNFMEHGGMCDISWGKLLTRHKQ